MTLGVVRVLATGATRFVGSHVAAVLRGRGHEARERAGGACLTEPRTRRRLTTMALLGWRLVALVALCVLALLTPRAGTGKVDAPDLTPYRGLGTWVDIYSPSFRSDPDRLAAALVDRGVDTLFVETGNFRQRADVVGRRQLSGLVEAAHARGIAIVAWYLPELTNPARDLRRARAAIAFRSSGGERFDSFGLDIESSAVRNSDERSRRLLELSARLRGDVGPDYPLGAIIPSPVGMKLLPRYWPRFPYAALARTYDVFLPMAYFSYRARGPAAVNRYVQTSVRIIRAASGDAGVPIHVIGGLAAVTSPTDAAAFAHAAASCGVYGLGLYDFYETKQSVWPLLERAASATPSAPHC
jgi:hypothetical protein